MAEIIGGLFGGFIAGITGYAIDSIMGATFEAFGSIIPLMALLGALYAIFSFLAGVSEAYLAGILFTIGIIGSGLLLGDLVTTMAGMISITGLVLSFFKGSTD